MEMNRRPACQEWQRLAVQAVGTRNFSHRVTFGGTGRSTGALRALPPSRRKLATVAASRAPMGSTLAWSAADVVDMDVEVLDEAVDESEAGCWALMAA